MKTLNLHVDDIEIGGRHRPLSDDAVTRLAGSMKDIGLRHPISVRIVDEMEVDGKMTSGVPVLVAGYHRLEAAKQLGWSQIDCIEVDDDSMQAELWELAENLHRLDLTKEQRDEHIRRYAELLEAKRQSRQNVAIESKRDDGKGHRPTGVASEIAASTGLSKRTIERALNPPAPTTAPPKEVFDVHEQARRRMVSAWNGATEDDRAWFRDWIDTPVMDQRYG